MEHSFCPGSKLLRQPAPEIFVCPSCGEEVEIWTDELRGACSKCRTVVFKNNSLSCLDWCKYGKECVGEDKYEAYMRHRARGIKLKLLEALEKYFGQDEKRIAHAKDVLAYAEQLLQSEFADWHIVIPASILHDVGIKAAEEKYGSSAGRYQEEEGPPIARGILLKAGLKLVDIDEICEIIGHHHSPGKIDTVNFKVVYDADCLVNIREAAETRSAADLETIIQTMFLTDSGKALAHKVLQVL
ncbi:MAG: HD domain-containing protein [Spirochaetota bacterium]